MALLTRQNLNRIYSGFRPFIIATVERLVREGLLSGAELAGRSYPLSHHETHERRTATLDPDANDEVLVEDITKLCVNLTASPIPIHKVVAVVGVGYDDTLGESRPSVELADATDPALLPPYGITLSELPAEAAGVPGEGRVMLIGEERGVDLVGLGSGTWLTGDELYLDHSTPGEMTKVLPAWPVYRIATVLAYEDTLADDDQDGILLVDVEDVSLINEKYPPDIATNYHPRAMLRAFGRC